MPVIRESGRCDTLSVNRPGQGIARDEIQYYPASFGKPG